MSARLHTISLAALVCCLVAASAFAQDASLAPRIAPPANLASVEGGVDLIHEGAIDRAAANSLLVDGDIVRTLNGRAEIVFADGTLLHLDHDTEIELLSLLRMRLAGGRVMLRVSAAATAAYVIDTHAAAVRLEPRGEYGITSYSRVEKLEVTVARGVAEIDDGGSRAVVRGGEMATILGAGGRVLLQAFNSARWDAFERWSNDRTNGFSTAASSRQLPPELRAYGSAFDSYGRWDYVAPYGNVWFPAVGASWRPYYAGGWSLTRYGWTWIGHDPWSWPTHHFGRWGFTGASWYWIPANVWGPAWVSWSFVPGYVSWCPLGWNGRPVFALSGRPGDHPAYWPNYSPWHAWTVVPRDSFGGRRHVRVNAIDPMTIPEQARRGIIGQNTQPAGVAESAVPRGTVSVPRPDRAPAAGAAESAVPRGAINTPRPGSVRRPDPGRSAPPARAEQPASVAPPADVTPPAYTRPSYAAPSASEQPPVYTPPAYAVPRPVRSDRGRESSAPPREAAPVREAAPPREAAPRERASEPQYAQPRRQERSSEASAPPPSRAPRGESRGEARGASVPSQDAPATGGARRRPPQ